MQVQKIIAAAMAAASLFGVSACGSAQASDSK